MKILKSEFQINVNIKHVWEFFTHIDHLEIVCHPNIRENVIMTSHKKLQKDSEVWCAAEYFGSRIWHSKITKLEEFEYVDEMQEGPFKKWVHRHEFKKIDENKTLVVDEIKFVLSYGIFSNLIEIFVRKKIQKILEHRAKISKRVLEIIQKL